MERLAKQDNRIELFENARNDNKKSRCCNQSDPRPFIYNGAGSDECKELMRRSFVSFYLQKAIFVVKWLHNIFKGSEIAWTRIPGDTTQSNI